MAITGWDKAQVELHGNLGAGSKLVVSGDSAHLQLKVDSHDENWFGKHGPNSDSDLVLHVPRSSALDVQVVSADASVTDMAGKTIQVHGVSGNLGVRSSAPATC